MDNPYTKDLQVTAIHGARRYLADRLTRVAAPHKLLDPAAGPLIAVKLHVLTRKTLGGLETDLSGRVLQDGGSRFPASTRLARRPGSAAAGCTATGRWRARSWAAACSRGAPPAGPPRQRRPDRTTGPALTHTRARAARRRMRNRRSCVATAAPIARATASDSAMPPQGVSRTGPAPAAASAAPHVRAARPAAAGPLRYILTADFSPDERSVATSSADGTVRLWDAVTGRPIGSALEGLPNVQVGAAFIRGGTEVATVYDGGRGYVWGVTATSWTRRACAIAGRTLTRSEWAETLPGQPYEPACVT